MNAARSVIWLGDIDTESDHFGPQSKQMARLIQAKFPLTPGFVISTHAYHNFLQDNGLEHKIRQLLSTISFERPESLMQAEFHIKQLFRRANLSETLFDLLEDFYYRLGDEVVMEMHETGKNSRKHADKNVTSEAGLVSEVINLWTEMFTGKALWHRHQSKLNHFDNKAEIIVRKKISGDTITGRIFTIDPHTHAKDKLVIITTHPHENDEYIISKKNLTIVDRTLKHHHLSDKLSLEEIHAIAKLAKRVEGLLYFPQEISWILSDNTLYIQTISPVSELAKPKTEKKSRLPIARGKGLTSAMGTGIVAVINAQTWPPIGSHHVIVISDIKPQHVKQLKKIKGLVIENHPHEETAAFLKQLGIPAICNVKNATKNLRDGLLITINGHKGEIYRGGMIN